VHTDRASLSRLRHCGALGPPLWFVGTPAKEPPIEFDPVSEQVGRSMTDDVGQRQSCGRLIFAGSIHHCGNRAGLPHRRYCRLLISPVHRQHAPRGSRVRRGCLHSSEAQSGVRRHVHRNVHWSGPDDIVSVSLVDRAGDLAIRITSGSVSPTDRFVPGCPANKPIAGTRGTS